MIVDLLRNDISRLSKVGHGEGAGAVRDGKLCDGASDDLDRRRGSWTQPATLPGLMAALFPCGSVTGRAEDPRDADHPRGRALARGVYCGAVGWMSPDGDGGFLGRDPDAVGVRRIRIVMNVGGGVTHGSTARGRMGGGAVESALREGGGEPGLKLIETVLWDGARLPRWPLHLARLRAVGGAAGLGLRPDG